MWISPELFQAAERLKATGYAPPLTAGIRVARGFADVGFEEFVILPNGNLMSLFTGEQRALKEDEIRHLVVIPDLEMITDELLAEGLDPLHLDYGRGNHWSFRTDQGHAADGRELLLVLLHGLLKQREL